MGPGTFQAGLELYEVAGPAGLYLIKFKVVHWTCVQCNVGDIPGASEDAVLQYSRTVMWEGLKDMVARDAIRENDGPAMISLWAMVLVQV